MSVDFMFLNEKCRRPSKITGKKAALTLQTHTWCEAGSSQGLEENPWLQEKYRATTATTFKTIGG
ncbi:hypothetical protein Bca4012_090149 [Brassica carinata]